MNVRSSEISVGPAEENLHPIKVVSIRTGLSAHVLRIWEKRYGAVTPKRTGSNRRLYNDEDIQRLTYMRLASERGHRIGQLAKMSYAELKELIHEDQQVEKNQQFNPNTFTKPLTPSEVVSKCLVATKELDEVALVNNLRAGAVQFGHQGLIEKVIGPLAKTIGEQWLGGNLKVAHEHFSSAIIRQFLCEIGRPYVTDPLAPKMIIATPSGQLHELGAAMVYAAGSSVGWNCKYLGSNINAEEIAGAATQISAKAVALSIVYPADDPKLPDEIGRLHDYLPPSTCIILGGKSAYAYASVKSKSQARNIHNIDSIPDLYAILEDIRARKYVS